MTTKLFIMSPGDSAVSFLFSEIGDCQREGWSEIRNMRLKGVEKKSVDDFTKKIIWGN